MYSPADFANALQRGAYTSLLVDDELMKSSPASVSNINIPPTLTITPALSGSVNDSDDDENTPLVLAETDSGRKAT